MWGAQVRSMGGAQVRSMGVGCSGEEHGCGVDR